MVKPCSLRDLFELLGKGSQAPKWWSCQLRGCCRRGLGITFVTRASRVHLYGGAAAMPDDVMQVQWEVEVYCARVTWPPAFALS